MPAVCSNQILQALVEVYAHVDALHTLYTNHNGLHYYHSGWQYYQPYSMPLLSTAITLDIITSMYRLSCRTA